MTVLKFDETADSKKNNPQLNSKKEKNMKTSTDNLQELISEQKNNETNNQEEEHNMEKQNETTNNVEETQVDFETMELDDVTGDNVKDFLAHHVSKVKEDSQSLTGTHLKARTAFTKSLIEIGHRINKICEVFKNHRRTLDENTWREYFNNNFPAKFYRSAEDYKRLANVAEIEDFCVLGKDRLLAVVKTFKDDLEGDDPKSMSELFIENGVSCDDMQDDNKVIQFTNDVDVMIIKKKFADNDIDEGKVKTVIENHRRYNKLFCKLKMVVNNNGDVNDYLNAIIASDWEKIRELEGRNTDVEPATTATPRQVVEEVKTYIVEKKGLLQSSAGENNEQYSTIISLMEQLEEEISRLNCSEAA